MRQREARRAGKCWGVGGEAGRPERGSASSLKPRRRRLGRPRRRLSPHGCAPSRARGGRPWPVGTGDRDRCIPGWAVPGARPGPRCPRRAGADVSRRPAETWERPLGSPPRRRRRSSRRSGPGGTAPAARGWQKPTGNASPSGVCRSAPTLAWGWQQPPAVNKAAGS